MRTVSKIILLSICIIIISSFDIFSQTNGIECAQIDIKNDSIIVFSYWEEIDEQEKKVMTSYMVNYPDNVPLYKLNVIAYKNNKRKYYDKKIEINLCIKGDIDDFKSLVIIKKNEMTSHYTYTMMKWKKITYKISIL